MPGEVKLKPCPFCGNAVGISHSIGDFWVKCFPCGASGGVRKDEESAIADWNRRTPEGKYGIASRANIAEHYHAMNVAGLWRMEGIE